MNSNDFPSINMTVDLKKYRFRVHRGTLHALGDPTHIQLMFDPDRKAIMLIVLNDSNVFGQAERVVFDKPGHDGSFQLYSMSLIQKIQHVFPDLEDQTSYCLTGKAIPSMRAVYFPLSSLSKIENNEAKTNDIKDYNRQGIQSDNTTSEGRRI